LNRFRIAQVSDLHLPLAEAPPRLRDLLGKRLFSWLSWRKSRRFIHRPEVLAALMADIRGAGADHLAVTGDLVNLALPDEFERAADWLAAQGSPEAVTVDPGNHDALVPIGWDEGLGRWGAWMGEAAGPDAFPFVKRLGDVAMVGVSSATPTAPFLASGRVGEAQLRRLEETLQALEQEGLFRVVLIHHPITEGAVPGRKALRDRAAVRAVLARAGAELVLHGHAHHATIAAVPGPRGEIPVVGAPSASSAPDAGGEAAGWRMIDVESTNAGWRIRVAGRRMTAGGAFVEDEGFAGEVARPRSG
jgi:3',5'-cyclic AMP phosphodiesterase CpdA